MLIWYPRALPQRPEERAKIPWRASLKVFWLYWNRYIPRESHHKDIFHLAVESLERMPRTSPLYACGVSQIVATVCQEKGNLEGWELAVRLHGMCVFPAALWTRPAVVGSQRPLGAGAGAEGRRPLSLSWCFAVIAFLHRHPSCVCWQTSNTELWRKYR